MPAIFDQITALQTLYRAFEKVEDNHGCAGADGVTIDDFGVYLDDNLSRLKAVLEAGKYRPLPLIRVYMEKADGKKRPLSIPTVRDRIAQTAAALVLTPIMEPEFEDVSFAYRQGRSVDMAVRRIMFLRNQGYQWVVDADIQSYFDEIPHTKLLRVLERFVDDAKVLKLVRLWIKAEVIDKGRKFRLKKGVPQGSPVSPLLANLYLDSFDEAHLRLGHKLVRFADDFVILCKSKPKAETALELSEKELSKLRLTLNREKTRVTHFNQGFRYLGVQFLRSLVYRPLYPETDSVVDRKEHAEAIKKPEKGASTPDGKTSMAMAMRETLSSLSPEEAKTKWKAITEAPELEETFIPLPTAGNDPTLRTLYIMEQGADICKEDERFVIRKGGVTLTTVPALKVDQVMIFGNIRITTPAMQFCLMEDIPVFLLSSRGRYYGVIESTNTDKVELHRDQFARATDPGFALAVAKEMVRGKITNSRVVLMRWIRKSGSKALHTAVLSMRNVLKHLDKATTVDELRGIEGAAAALYFGVWRGLIGKEWGFEGRKKRPPTDPVNSLLSYGYTLLFYNTYSMARSRGLHPHVGLYHTLRQGHPALVSDLMEEFRAPVVDSTVLSLVHGKKVSLDDFKLPSEPGMPCLLSDEARKKVTRALESAMNRAITHPDAGSKCDYRRAIALQAERLVKVIKGQKAMYEPFILR